MLNYQIGNPDQGLYSPQNKSAVVGIFRKVSPKLFYIQF